MKILMTYYSYSGVTDKVIRIFAETLKKKVELVIQRLKPKAEITSFIGQCHAAFTRKRIIVLLTSGSGAGIKKCLNNIRAVLENKGASHIDEINIPNATMKDPSFITSSIENML